MARGVTPKSQPIDAFVAKVFKGIFREYYDNYMINADENQAGHPIPPSRQLMEIWVAKAWNDVPEELVCGYQISEELETEEDSQVLNLANDQDYILTELYRIDGGKYSFHALNPENDYES